MTLLVAGIAEPYGVILSDRRLTSDGNLIDDEANKMTVLLCADARVVVTFTGLARFRDFDTAAFVRRELAEGAEPDRRIYPLLNRFLVALRKGLSDLPLSARDKRLSLLIAGYRYDEKEELAEAVLSRISNFESGNAVRPEAADRFWVNRAAVRGRGSARPYHFVTAGMTGSLADEHIREMQQLLHEHRPPRAIASKGLEIGLGAAQSKASRGTIGTSWSSAVIPSNPDDSIWIQYHAPTATTTVFGADFVDASPGPQPVVTIANLEIETATPISMGFPGTRRNARCPCGSGVKYKHCHGKRSAGIGGFFINRLSSPDPPSDVDFEE